MQRFSPFPNRTKDFFSKLECTEICSFFGALTIYVLRKCITHFITFNLYVWTATVFAIWLWFSKRRFGDVSPNVQPLQHLQSFYWHEKPNFSSKKMSVLKRKVMKKNSSGKRFDPNLRRFETAGTLLHLRIWLSDAKPLQCIYQAPEASKMLFFNRSVIIVQQTLTPLSCAVD